MKIKRIDKKLKLDFMHALIFFICVFSIFCIWVNHSFQGNYWGPFLQGSDFGIPSRESNIGMYSTSKTGWDAQFYYYESNDIFATGDEYLHIDNPPYRYQRIGMPLIARIISLIMGKSLTPPLLYNFLQLFIVSLAFFILIRWLRRNSIKQIYAYTWILSIGVINALAYGMPDPVGDAFFIMSIIFALDGELLLYMIVTIFLLLVREGYSLYAAIIFILTIFNKIQWKCNDLKRKAIFTMIPGIIVVLWMGYVTYRFGITPISATKGYNLTDFPFMGSLKTFISAIKSGNVKEAIFNEFGVIIILFSIYSILKVRKSSCVWYGVLGYVFLMASLGTIVWNDFSGYMKALGSVIAAVIIAMAYNKNKTYKVVASILCIVIVMQGVFYNYKLKKDIMFTKYEQTNFSENTNSPNNNRLKEFSSKIQSDQSAIEVENNANWVFKKFLRKIDEVGVTVTNTSNEDWYANPQNGLNSISLSYNIYDENGENILYEGIRTEIGTDILSGQTRNMKMKFNVPYDSGKYILRISMIQEGVAWFDLVNGGYLDIPLEVK